MGHPDVKLHIEMAYDPEFGGYAPRVAGLADDSPYRGKMTFDECVEAITFFTDFLSSYNLLGPEDDPDDMDKVSEASEQLLLEALYQVHGRWDIPLSALGEERAEEDEDSEEADEDEEFDEFEDDEDVDPDLN